MRRTVRRTVVVDPLSCRSDWIMTSRAFALDQARGLFLVLPGNSACRVWTDPRHHDIVDPRHEFVALAGRRHWTLQTDGDSAQFKRFAVTGGSADRGMDEFMRSDTNDPDVCSASPNSGLTNISKRRSDEVLSRPALPDAVSVGGIFREADRDADIIRDLITCRVEPWSEQTNGGL